MTATKKVPVSRIDDKLAKVNDHFTVYMYDNGFMLEVGGRDHNEEWTTAKVLCKSMDELTELIKQATEIERE